MDSAPPPAAAALIGGISAHDRRRIAVSACAHPRTVDRAYQGVPVRSTVAARIIAAAEALGLPPPDVRVAP